VIDHANPPQLKLQVSKLLFNLFPVFLDLFQVVFRRFQALKTRGMKNSFLPFLNSSVEGFSILPSSSAML